MGRIRINPRVDYKSVGIRLTEKEREAFEMTAKKDGFTTVSAWVIWCARRQVIYSATLSEIDRGVPLPAAEWATGEAGA